MRIERVTQNQLKITLSNDDLREWDINLDQLSRNPDEAQELFWALIRQADDETGYFTDGSQLIVEAVPKADGYSMTVTKIEDDDPAQPAKASARARLRRDTRPKRPAARDHVLIVQFADFDALLQACKAIENRFAGYSRLYKQGHTYFLVLDVINEFLAADLELLLSEYGCKAADSAIGEGQLAEYGRLLMGDNAVGKVVSFF